jgi:hypothetical protein
MKNKPKTKPIGLHALKRLAEMQIEPGREPTEISFPRFCDNLSAVVPGLGSLWIDYCTYLQSTQPRPDLN